MYTKKSSDQQDGQTLMELIVVVSVSVIVISALVFAIISSLRNAQFAKNQAQATKLAQEGLERVRVGRDRDKNISGLTIGGNTISSWNGNNTDCPANNSSIWCNQINGSCDNSTLTPPTFCYFNVTQAGVLNHLTVSSVIPSGAEAIPPLPANAIFRRAIILSDDSSYQSQKTVTSVVEWSDYSGDHQSRLTTILRKK